MPTKKETPHVTFRSELSRHLKPTTVYGIVVVAVFMIGFLLGTLRPTYNQSQAAIPLAIDESVVGDIQYFQE